MNYYERIQKSIDYIEDNICEELVPERYAEEAYMSLSGYYRLFFSITRMTVMEYVRARRLTYALADLADGMSVLDTAVKYCFNSADGFSRSFKRMFGILPSRIKTINYEKNIMRLERLNIMDSLFENDELLDKYPEIKVIKELGVMKVACFSYFGKNPEDHAFEELKKWFKENELSLHDSAYRMFGYNNPDPQEGASEYAYEYCMTIPDDVYDTLEDVPIDMREMTYPKVYRKILTGGKYAVMSVKRDGKEIGEQIMAAWPRLIKWLGESKYIWGTNQYLEEHLGFSDENDHIGSVDLYISIAEGKSNLISNIVEEIKVKEKLLVFREEGTDFELICKKSWQRALAWAEKSGLDGNNCSLYQYNQGYQRPKVLYNVVMIGIPTDYNIEPAENGEYTIATLEEGKYAVLSTTWAEEGMAWEAIGKWCKKNKIGSDKRQWLEECEHDGWNTTDKIRCLFPIN